MRSFFTTTEMYHVPAADIEKRKRAEEVKKQEAEKARRAEHDKKQQEAEKVRRQELAKKQLEAEKARLEELAKMKEVERVHKEEEIRRPIEIEKAWRKQLFSECDAYRNALFAENAKLLDPILKMIKESRSRLYPKPSAQKFFVHPQSEEILRYLKDQAPPEPSQQELYHYLAVKSR